MKEIRACLVGISGYAGMELARLLASHPAIRLVMACSRAEAGRRLGDFYPFLRHLPGADVEISVYEPAEAIKNGDLAFLAVPAGTALRMVPELLAGGLKVVDFSADYRLRDKAVYAEWYGAEHTSAHLLAEAVYGLPELYAARIADARLAANPGCYPTASILGLRAALKHGLIEPDSIIIDAVSGASGAGRKAAVPTLFCEISDNFRAYGVPRHRHTPEIEQELAAISGQPLAITFTPHIAPMKRGILATIYARLRQPDLAIERIHAIFAETWRDWPWIRVLPPGALPETAHVRGSMFCDIAVAKDERTGRLIILSAIDNLCRGAAGQALACANLMCGLDMGAGLSRLAPPGMSSLIRELEAATHDPVLCSALVRRLDSALAGAPMRFMEVCGTHTVSIFQSGLRSLLPVNVKHISGPGCPVCVTHEAEVALFLQIAARQDTIIATFGDLMRVPGPGGASLKDARADGARVEIVYSPLEAVALARSNPGCEVVFPGIGFETTAPVAAGAIAAAQAQNIANFSVLSLHKLVPPVLAALLAQNDVLADAFLLPGHVAMVTGLEPFVFLAQDFAKPAVAGGFEPADILLALCAMAEQLQAGKPAVANAYPRAVSPGGNPRALALMERVFCRRDALWRGMGLIPDSGLGLRDEFASFDAMRKLGLTLPKADPVPGCRCGEILKGVLQPPDCPLFGKRCTPASPVGPCMVSTEGSCAAWHKYGDI